jgi:hypothetical protein
MIFNQRVNRILPSLALAALSSDIVSVLIGALGREIESRQGIDSVERSFKKTDNKGFKH